MISNYSSVDYIGRIKSYFSSPNLGELMRRLVTEAKELSDKLIESQRVDTSLLNQSMDI